MRIATFKNHNLIHLTLFTRENREKITTRFENRRKSSRSFLIFKTYFLTKYHLFEEPHKKIMDLLIRSDSESDNDDILEVTKEVGTRSSFRDKQLMKMFAIREILKWKYNYFEANAIEHPLYTICSRSFKGYRKSFAFKKLWRLRMDKEYDEETIKMHRIFLERQLKKLNQASEPSSTVLDPSRLLVNYDREVLNMIRRVRDEFNTYLLFPERYSLYEVERKNFLIDQCVSAAKYVTQISMDDITKNFAIYWEDRVGVLCDLKISREKKLIRRDWKQLLPIYHSLVKGSCSELKELLLTDDEEETDEN